MMSILGSQEQAGFVRQMELYDLKCKMGTYRIRSGNSWSNMKSRPGFVCDAVYGEKTAKVTTWFGHLH